MQNLFVKFLVLGSVIGSSCFVVWQAHDGLKSVAKKGVSPEEFVSFENENASHSEMVSKVPTSSKEEVVDWEHPLSLSPGAQEPVPTPAATALAQQKLEDRPALSELQTFDPLGSAPAGQMGGAAPAANQELDDSEFPKFGEKSEQTESSVASMTPADREPVANESVPTLVVPGDAAGMKSDSAAAAAAFLELPNQQIEKPESAGPEVVAIPSAEPLPAQMKFERLDAVEPEMVAESAQGTSKKEKAEETVSEPIVQTEPDLQRFGPGMSAASAQESVADDQKVTQAAEEMPGLTRLPPTHPGPVLLPVQNETAQAAPATDAMSEDPFGLPGKVVTADGIEAEGSMIQKTSDSNLAASAPELLPRREAPSMPAQLPEAPAKRENREMPAGDPFGADPFGGSTQVEPTPVRTREVPPLLREREPASVETMGAPPGGAPEVTPLAQPELLPTLSVKPVEPSVTTGGLPENQEVLPEMVPAVGIGEMPMTEPASPQAMDRTRVVPVAAEIPESMPPLPPTNEILPDIVPGTNAGPAPAPAAMPVAVDEVLPLPVNELGTSSKTPPPASVGPPPTVPEVSVQPSPVASPSGNPVPAEVSPFPAMPASSLPNLTTITPTVPPEKEPAAAVGSPLIGTTEFDVASAPRGPQSPELKIEKIAPTEAEVGEPVIYSIVIRNVGGSEAKDVIVEDRIPRGARLEGTIPVANLHEGKLYWQLKSIEPGGERKIQLKVTPIEPGQIGSVATVSFSSAVSASIKVNAPKLVIDMKGPQQAIQGEPVNFQFTLRNVGQGVAKSVFLRTMLPSGLSHPGGQDLEYESGTLAPGAEKVIDLIVHADKPGVYTLHSQVTNDGKAHADSRAELSVIKARLELTRTGPENRFIGRPANVMLRVANTSSDVLRNITVQEKLPAGIELPALPGNGRWDQKTRTVTWTLDELKPGEAKEISVFYIAREVGELTGRLVAADQSGNQCALDTKVVVKGFSELTPDFKIEQRTVLVNERVTMQVKLRNTGSEESRNIKAQFTLPEEFEFISARGPVDYQHNGRNVQFLPITSLPAGGEETFHLAILATRPTVNATKVTLMIQSDDFSDPVFQDQAIRVIPNTPTR